METNPKVSYLIESCLHVKAVQVYLDPMILSHFFYVYLSIMILVILSQEQYRSNANEMISLQK